MTETLPVTRSLPMLGAVPYLFRNSYEFLLTAREMHGDIYTLNLGVTKLVVLNSPRHAEHLLRDRVHEYSKAGPVWDLLRTVIGDGLATSEGDAWLRQRRMMQQGFHRGRLPALSEAMVRAIGEGITSWEEHADSPRPFDLVPAFGQVAMRILMRAMFGEEADEAELAEMTVAVTFMLEYATWAMIASALPGRLPLPGGSRYRRNLRKIDSYVSAVISDRRKERGGSDLISMMLEMTDPQTGSRMTDDEIRDQTFTIFMAGYETTALTLAWALYFLARHPEVKRGVHKEIDRVLGNGPASFADIPGLDLTRRVLQETLRLRPPAFWLPRTAMVDDEIDGHAIPRGTNLALLIFGLHHDSRHWPAPRKFDPDRFLPEHLTGRHPYAWIPFGAGQRQCIGKDFALLEAQLCLATVLQRYDIRIPPGYTAKPRFMSTLRPRGGIEVFLRNRGAEDTTATATCEEC